MYAWRMCLVGTAVLALLLGPVGPASAAAEDETVPDGAAVVSGYMYYPGGAEYGVIKYEDDWIVSHEQDRGDLQTDDPRLSGTLDMLSTNHQMRGGVAHVVFSGTATVTNDLGSWVGTLQGYSPKPGLHEYLVELTGEDGYEGLSATLFFREDPDHTYKSLISGIIYVGPQPPLPEPPAE